MKRSQGLFATCILQLKPRAASLPENETISSSYALKATPSTKRILGLMYQPQSQPKKAPTTKPHLSFSFVPAPYQDWLYSSGKLIPTLLAVSLVRSSSSITLPMPGLYRSNKVEYNLWALAYWRYCSPSATCCATIS